jgi:hypothetical protein
MNKRKYLDKLSGEVFEAETFEKAIEVVTPSDTTYKEWVENKIEELKNRPAYLYRGLSEEDMDSINREAKYLVDNDIKDSIEQIN